MTNIITGINIFLSFVVLGLTFILQHYMQTQLASGKKVPYVDEAVVNKFVKGWKIVNYALAGFFLIVSSVTVTKMLTPTPTTETKIIQQVIKPQPTKVTTPKQKMDKDIFYYCLDKAAGKKQEALSADVVSACKTAATIQLE